MRTETDGTGSACCTSAAAGGSAGASAGAERWLACVRDERGRRGGEREADAGEQRYGKGPQTRCQGGNQDAGRPQRTLPRTGSGATVSPDTADGVCGCLDSAARRLVFFPCG